MFEGMEDIEGADPYTISDLRTGAPGIGSQAGMAGMGAAITPESRAESATEAKAAWAAQAAPKAKSWSDYLTGGITAIGGAIGAQAQVAQMAQAQKLQQMAQAGQISQQAYQEQLRIMAQRAELVRQQSMHPQGFFTKYKWPLLLGVVVIGGAVYWFWYRKRR